MTSIAIDALESAITEKEFDWGESFGDATMLAAVQGFQNLANAAGVNGIEQAVMIGAMRIWIDNAIKGWNFNKVIGMMFRGL